MPARPLRPARLAASLLLSAGAASAAPGTPGDAASFGFDALPAGLRAERVAEGGADGAWARFDGKQDPGPPVPLSAEVGPALSVGASVRADAWPAGQNGNGFGPEAPPSLLTLHRADGEPVAFLRVRQGRPELAVQTAPGAFVSVRADEPLPTGRWVQVTATHDAGTARLYVDGREAASKPTPPPLAKATGVSLGATGKRRLVGGLDEVFVVGEALTLPALRERLGMEPLEGAAGGAAPAVRPLPPVRDAGRELQLTPDAVARLAEGTSAQGEFVRFSDAAAAGGVPDLLFRAFSEKPEIALWTGGEARPDGGLLYRERTLAADAPWGGGLAGGPWFRVERPGGGFELVGSGARTALGGGELVAYPAERAGGEVRFAEPYAVRFDGYPLAALLPELGGSNQPCAVVDLDGDGTQDFLLGKIEKRVWPDGETNPWTRRETRYLGKGRTYAANGAYLGTDQRTEFYWARGSRDADGKLGFGPALPILQGREDFPLLWSGESPARITAMRIGGVPHLVMIGSLEEVLAARFEVEGDALRAGEARPLLAGGAVLKQVYLPHHLDPVDLDGDGTDELLVSGNPGSIALLRGDAVGGFREHGVFGLGGPLRMQTLVVPQRVDFDGDGVQDVLMGDASGFFELWPGTADPLVYGSPRPLTLGGEPWHFQAHPHASIQGPHERRWGYVNPLATDWDGDGRLDVLFGHTGTDLRVARGLGGLAVAEPEPIRRPDGSVWEVAWRQRPAVVPTADPSRKRLLFQDWDGDLALADFEAATPMIVRGEEKLRYEDGGALPLSGPGGFWGRGKPTVADWDGDGDWDVVYGGHGGNNRYVDPALEPLTLATALVFENTGTGDAPRFARPRLLFAEGEPIQVAKHVAGVWPTDLDGDGRLDLLVGTDNGRVYAWNRRELEERPAAAAGAPGSGGEDAEEAE